MLGPFFSNLLGKDNTLQVYFNMVDQHTQLLVCILRALYYLHILKSVIMGIANLT